MIDTGKIVVCTASSTFQCHESGEDGAIFDLPRIHNYLKAPDGWIVSSDMMKIMELKPGSKWKLSREEFYLALILQVVRHVQCAKCRIF